VSSSEQIKPRIDRAPSSHTVPLSALFQWPRWRFSFAAVPRALRAAFVQLAAVARLSRMNSGATSATAAVLTAWMANPPVPPQEMVLIAAVVFMLSSGGYALNDVCDREIDKINQPGRPIPAKKIRSPQAALIAGAWFVGAVALSLLLSAWCIGVALVDVVLLVVYALWSKSLGMLKSIIVGYLVASGFLIGAFTFDRIDAVIGTLIACAFFATMAREIVKDIQDVEGDSHHGARTLPIMTGRRMAYAAAFACLVVSFLIAAIPYAMDLVNDSYLALMLLAALMSLIAWHLRASSPRFCQYMIMAGSIVVLAAFGFGSL
jgi:geranylgeranylglycerol-phosphate geranylgeranyltransferase